jgi:hypothetical protein
MSAGQRQKDNRQHDCIFMIRGGCAATIAVADITH